MKRLMALVLYALLGWVGNANSGQLPVDLPNTCYASDATSLATCVTRVRNTDAGTDTIDNIKITAAIACTGANACLIDMSNLNNTNRSVTIYGTSITGTGLNRNYTGSQYNYPLVKIANTKNIRVRDMYFKDGTSNTSSGWGTINISDSNNILVDAVRVEDSKFANVALVGATNVMIRNSELANSRVYGVWTSSQYVSTGVRVENNVISGAWANGILYAGTNGWITGNLFTGNHAQSVFGYSGGQVLLEASANNVYVQWNEIKNGTMPYPGLVSGVEFAPDYVNNVDVSYNSIHDNTGYGVVINGFIGSPPATLHISNINIHNNNFSSNGGADISYPAHYTPTSSNNCQGSNFSCVGTKPWGTMSSTASTCTTTGSSCTISVIWSSSNTSSPKVTIDEVHALFSTNANSTQSANWVARVGGYFEFYSGNLLLATKWIIAVSP